LNKSAENKVFRKQLRAYRMNSRL